MAGKEEQFHLHKFLSEKQIHHVLEQAIGFDVLCTLETSEIKPAVDGIAGFLGEHMKATLHVDVNGEKKKVHLFLKQIPVLNKDKAKFIDENNIFRREQLMFKILEEIRNEGSSPWCVTAYNYTESMIVMPDLSIEGYKTKNSIDTLDLEHVFTTATTIARFHAAFVNYETKKSIDLQRPYNTLQEYSQILTEPMSQPKILETCCKLSVTLLKALSTKSYGNLPDIESKLYKLMIEACDTLKEYKDTINVLLHRDLWVNNIMFKYKNELPVNAVLVDYQCVRYGPPAFDIILFLYLTTDRRFREERERDVLKHYFSVFVKNLNNDSIKRLQDVGYDEKNFLNWCERGRMFGMIVTIAIYPLVLMDSKTAEKIFDDPETFDKHIFEDRSKPVLDYADKNELYKHRNLSVLEEVVERYLLRQL